MRYRIGIIRRDCGISDDVEILADWIDNRSTVKKIINYGIKHQTDWEFIHGSYFAEYLNDEGVWVNITDYWNYQAQEGLEALYDAGKITADQLDEMLTTARYGWSDEVDYILIHYGNFEEHYAS